MKRGLSVLSVAALVVGLPVAASAEGRPHVCKYYPPLARTLHQLGTVQLSYCIKTDGKLGHLTVNASSGHLELDKAALWCASYWQYIPAIEHGKPISVPWKASITWAETSDKHVISYVTELPGSPNEQSTTACSETTS